MNRSIVLLSGGMDSALAAALVQSRGAEVVPVAVSYGQRHGWELRAADRVARFLGLQAPLTASIGWATVAGSPLASRGVDPISAPAAVVPARNLAMLAVAANAASQLGAFEVVIGCNADDAEHFRDCRGAALEAAGTAIGAALSERIRVRAPFLSFTKAQAVAAVREVIGPDRVRTLLALTWSCYNPIPVQDPKRITMRPCTACGACNARSRAFSDLGEEDPAS